MTKTKFERDKVYKTRDGQEARVICVDAPEPLPIVVLTLKEKPYSLWRSLWRVGADGRVDEDTDSQFDLMLPKPEPIVEWGVWTISGRFVPATCKMDASDCVKQHRDLSDPYTGARLAKRTTEIVED